MKNIFSSRRNKSPHNNEEAEKSEAPFFSKENKTPFFNNKSATVQTKLTIGQPNDKYEKEADTMADAVVNSSSKPDIQNKEISNIQRESLVTPQEDEKFGTAEQRMEEDKMVQEKPEIQKMEAPEEEMVQQMEGEEEEPVQTKSNGKSSTANAGLSQQIKSKSGKGKGLSKNTQAEMESSFKTDFSDVNIHTDNDAVNMNKELGAQAFTHGKDVYFNSGKYNPDSSEGKHLLTHELTHVVQQSGGQKSTLQRFEVEDTAVEMVGKTFILNIALKAGSLNMPKGSKVKITAWTNNSTTASVEFTSGKSIKSLRIEKKHLVPMSQVKSGLYQYQAGVTGVEKKYASIEKKIKAQEKVIKDWEAQKGSYKSEKGKVEWNRQMTVKKTELADLKYKLTGEGYTPATLPDRLKKTIKGKRVSIATQSDLLNKSLIEQTMLNTFDANIVKWVSHYNKTIGTPKKWPALDANIVKSMLYQESHMGTHGTFLKKPPYSQEQRMTRFNIGQTIDSSGPQQILMIKEISPAIHSKYKLDQITKDMWAAKKRQKELAKMSTRTPIEQTELDGLNARSRDGKGWNRYFTTDLRWRSAVKEFFLETAKARNLDYDYWIQTTVRWLFEKRKGENDWGEAIRAYNGSGDKARKYKKDVIKRRDDAKSTKGEFTPKQHY